MGPGGLKPNGKGITTTQKVRLMHASIRYYVKRQTKQPLAWKAKWGEPISQQDLANVLMTFSATVIDGLRHIGLPLSDGEEVAYFHAWRVVGHLLGIRNELIPRDLDDGRRLQRAIGELKNESSPEGAELTRALVDFLARMGLERLFPDLGSSAIRYCIGDEAATMLEVAKSNWKDVLVLKAQTEVFGAIDDMEGRIPALGKVFGKCSRELIQALTDLERGGNRPPFAIPPNLYNRWT